MATSELSRIRAVTRDELKLRASLARLRDNRFDIEAAQQVRHRVDDLLETLTFIERDDDLWDRLTTTAQTLEIKHIDALSWFSEAAFGSMLVASGYSSPPPPTVDDLVRDTRHALSLALSEGRPEHVKDARISLISFVYRTERQVRVADEPAFGPSTIDVVGRRVAEVARKVIPIAVGAGAGAVVSPFLGPTGGVAAGSWLASFLGKSIEAAVTKGAELATYTAMGYGLTDPPPNGGNVRKNEQLTPDQAIAAHLATAHDSLRTFIDARSDRTTQKAGEIMRHLKRVIELSADHGGVEDLESAATLALKALGAIREQSPDSSRSFGDSRPPDDRELLALAFDALEIAVATRGEPSEFGTPLYSDGPFASNRLRLRGTSHELQRLWAAWTDSFSAPTRMHEELRAAEARRSTVGVLKQEQDRRPPEESYYTTR